MQGPTLDPVVQVPGFRLQRVLSDREASKVFLAQENAGNLRALKLQLPGNGRSLSGISARYQRLQPLTRCSGFTPLLAYGTNGQGWVWECLALADNLPGLPPVEQADGIEQYTPLTLRAWALERRPAAAKPLALWGARLASALAALHAEGLAHRDLKPANILLIGGEPCLADYGLVGEPGASMDFSGTEGFKPLEGTADFAADLFALGKTLYETWTGCDRLEFPSLPEAVLDAADWGSCGNRLNEVILRACESVPRLRFRSAADLAAALSECANGCRPLSRRRWILASFGGIAAAGAGFLIAKHLRPPARVISRLARQKGFNVEAWEGNLATVDWQQRRMYSINLYKGACLLQSLDLDTFQLVERELAAATPENDLAILNPETRELWMIRGGKGEVIAIRPLDGSIRSLGGGPHDDRHFGARPYWNPITRRVGVFGGYGEFAVRNDRSEFDSSSGRWIELEPDRRDTELWPREMRYPFIPEPTGRRIYLIGGYGSPSGIQGRRVEGLPDYDGQFHTLSDIWELDLQKGYWRKVLPLGHFDPTRLRAAIWHPRVQGLLHFEGISTASASAGTASVSLLRPDIDRLPVWLPMTGQCSELAFVSGWALDPVSEEIVMLADDGIFRMNVRLS